MNSVQLHTPLATRPPATVPASQYASALSSGDPRYQVKKLDRAGLSRGAAQRNQAGIAAAQEMTAGIADAYSRQMQDSQQNASATLQDQVAQENQALALGALQQQNNYANQMAALQRQGSAMNMFTGLLGGLLR